MPEDALDCERLRSLLRELLALWQADWANADYLGEGLPRLLANPETGTRKERDLAKGVLSEARDKNLTPSDLIEIAREERFETDLAEVVVPTLELDLRHFQLARAQKTFEEYEQVLSKEWYEARRAERIRSRRRTIQMYVSSRRFEEGSEWVSMTSQELRGDEASALAEWYQSSLAQAVSDFIDAEVMPLLRRYRFEEARAAFKPVEPYAKPQTIDLLEGRFREERAAVQEERHMRELLARHDFLGAQALYEASKTLSAEQFSRQMGPYVQEYFGKHCGFSVDEYKARAMSTTSRRTLVEARAGSGKTTLLACFVRLLQEKLDVDLDEVLVMAFNGTAARRIGSKINELLRDSGFGNARTFHSLAWHIAEGHGWTKVLSDDPKLEKHEQERRRFVEDTWKELRRSRPWILALAFLMFRKELKPQELQLNPDSEDYYLYRRNECQSSLRGENVKSWGEKVIADFLLEHGIPYSYERSVFWGKKLYRPDFTLFAPGGERVILEHWAIDPRQSTAQVPPHWGKSTEQYRAEIEAKRALWRQERTRLLETNANAVAALGREGFERRLSELLADAGFHVEKLDPRRIMAQVSDGRTRRFAELLGQAISLAKKAGLTPAAMRQHYRDPGITDPKIRAFGSIACRVFKLYEKRMEEHGLTDYDSLLRLAADRVEHAHGDLVVRDQTRGYFQLSQLTWVLIDEYQDFSLLFDNLIRAIGAANPELRIFCVGDNWQAINGFAGSDTRFIERFEVLNREECPLRFAVPVNRRSEKRIVAAGNAIMRGVPGSRAIPREGTGLGDVDVMHVDDTYVELRKEGAYRRAFEEDERFRVTTESDGREWTDVLASKYLKLVTRIVGNAPCLTYSVLTRTNWLSSIHIREFESRLRSCLGDDFLEEMDSHEGCISVSTVHSYKGEESDVSIVLRVVDRQFPLVHPDSALLAPLGQTPERVIEEERRLFYVAISRARARLLLVTERDRESLFLEEVTGRAFSGDSTHGLQP